MESFNVNFHKLSSFSRTMRQQHSEGTMSSYPKRLIQAGFTLVELLIVVIILAVLAAIIVPQFSSATKDAQDAALDANLSSIRSAIELYRAQHNGAYPGAIGS